VNVFECLQEFDGKNTIMLAEYCDRGKPSLDELKSLVDVCCSAEQRLRIAATWMLKRYGERGDPLPEAQVPRLLRCWNCWDDWESTLHLLQMLGNLKIPDPLVEATWNHCRALANCDNKRSDNKRSDNKLNDNKMVRAWALNGLAQVSLQRSGYRSEALQKCRKALEDDSAAVRARARKLVKMLEKATDT
jgi:hypothetical protein